MRSPCCIRSAVSRQPSLSRLGFTAENWESLDLELRRMAVHETAELGELTPFGQKYVIRAPLLGPKGLRAEIRSVWIILHGEQVPRLVTILPED